MLGRTLELTAVSSHTSADHPFRSWPNNPMLVSMAENRCAVAAWSAGVSAVAAAFVAIIASRATTSLSRNAWLVACLVVALIAFAILLAAGVPDIISWLRERKDKPARHSTLADAQLRDHFEPRARGILPSQIREGSYFTGRMKAACWGLAARSPEDTIKGGAAALAAAVAVRISASDDVCAGLIDAAAKAAEHAASAWA